MFPSWPRPYTVMASRRITCWTALAATKVQFVIATIKEIIARHIATWRDRRVATRTRNARFAGILWSRSRPLSSHPSRGKPCTSSSCSRITYRRLVARLPSACGAATFLSTPSGAAWSTITCMARRRSSRRLPRAAWTARVLRARYPTRHRSTISTPGQNEPRARPSRLGARSKGLLQRQNAQETSSK